jgi:mRNA interferase RelE/StbE
VTWRLHFTPSAQKEADALDPTVRKQIARGLARLLASPYDAPNVKTLTDGRLRLRIGDWRVIYILEHNELVVLVIRLAHRREVYR